MDEREVDGRVDEEDEKEETWRGREGSSLSVLSQIMLGGAWRDMSFIA